MDENERKLKAQDAARRLEKATKDIAAEGRFGGPDATSTELEMMEEATDLIRKVTDNRDALMQIGRKAIERGQELGLTPSCSDFDPLARFGGDREAIREKLLLSNAIEVAMEDRGIADAHIEALLERPIEDVDIDALQTALERLRAT